MIGYLCYFTGSNHLYVFINPLNKEGSEDLPAEITWEFAQKEIAQVKGFSTSTGAGLTKGIYYFQLFYEALKNGFF